MQEGLQVTSATFQVEGSFVKIYVTTQSAQNTYEQLFVLIFTKSSVLCPLKSIENAVLSQKPWCFLAQLIFTEGYHFHIWFLSLLSSPFCFGSSKGLFWVRNLLMGVSRGLGRPVETCFLSPPATWSEYRKAINIDFFSRLVTLPAFCKNPWQKVMVHLTWKEAALPGIFRVATAGQNQWASVWLAQILVVSCL